MIRSLMVCAAIALCACGKGERVTPVVDAGMSRLPDSVCLDNDGDGFPGTGDCTSERMIDCNDREPSAFPNALELCNGLDDNCNSEIDEGLPVVAYYLDADADGVGAMSNGEGCKGPPVGSVTQSGDCNDSDATIRPGQAETCNGVDDDCDGTADNGLPFQDFYLDGDGDGFGASGSAPVNSCQTSVQGRVSNPGDCDDINPSIKPGAIEFCNQTDDNCDGQMDNGIAFVSYYPDIDGDGFGDARSQSESSCAPIPGKVENDSDCNDADATVKPGAPETCNAVDDDCDTQVDEGLTFVDYYPDGDGDTFGSAVVSAQRSCTPITGRVTNSTDCNDANAAINPSRAEVCNALDDNCAGGIDEGLPTQSYYVDSDLDGRGRQGSTAVATCGPVSGRVTSNDDCDDSNASVKPGAAEMCNGVDDNCDGLVDNGVTTQNYYVDGDGDGFGASGSVAQGSCSAITGRVTNNLDCNDSNSLVKPTATEICNQVDDDCDQLTDEGLTVLAYYPDLDGDGFGAAGAAAQNSCAAVSGKVSNDTDCNDSNLNIRPGAAEVCNGINDNCVNGIDEGLPTQSYYPDADTDGFGATGSTALASCGPVSGRVTNNSDCNDGSSAIKPTASELCNGVDDNCVGGVDEGNPGGGGACSTGQSGVCGPGTLQCQSGTVACVQNVASGAESCNGLDDNCNGTTDEGFTGLGTSCSAGVGACARSGTQVCNAGGTAVVCSAPVGSPTAAACDGVDNDCDGITDEPLLTTTSNVSATAFQDLEVRPYYSGACGGGANGSGTDTLTGGALLMGAGVSGITFQRLDTGGAPAGGSTWITSLIYSDVDFAQAGDGFVVAGIWSSNNAEIDLYYTDPNGTQRAYRFTQFVGATSQTLDSLRVVRGNGRRVSLVWRENGTGIKLGQVEACPIGAGWELRAPGCVSTTLTAVTLSPSTTAVPGVGADSAHSDWAATQTCVSVATQRRIGIAYLPTPTSLHFFRVNENGAAKDASEIVAHTEAAPNALAEPDLAFFKDGVGGDQYFLAYVMRDSSTLGPRADLQVWLTSDPTYNFAYFAYATQNGVNSIARPRTSATASGLWVSAIRSVNDATTFKKQVMTRKFDLLGNRTPAGSAVELSATSGACAADPACRPGDKSGFTNWAPFSKLFYAGSGSTPVGSFSSTLTCN